MLALGVDTSNYATSLAVVNAADKEVVCALKRFLPVPQGGLGLRQSDAVFHHTTALPQLLAELREKADLSAIRAAGASARPRDAEGSYMPCFLPGTAFGGAFAAGAGLQLVETSHQQGHLAAALLGANRPELMDGDILFFHVSGGTTELLLTHGYTVKQRLGGSLDVHAGQLVDRLGVKLGHPFPAGEAVSRLAEGWHGPSIAPKVSVKGMETNLSGVQNQCEAMLERGEPAACVARYCLAAIAKSVELIVKAARESLGGLPVLCAGGVLASGVIRAWLDEALKAVYYAPPALSADNAVGVAMIAAHRAGKRGA